MKTFCSTWCAVVSVCCAPAISFAAGSLVAPSIADETQGATYTLPTFTIDNGGGSATGGIFAITGTAGQADADPLQPSSGGAFDVTGGFWPGIDAASSQAALLFADGFE